MQGFGALVLLIFVSAGATALAGGLEEQDKLSGRELAMNLQASSILLPNGSDAAAGAASGREPCFKPIAQQV